MQDLFDRLRELGKKPMFLKAAAAAGVILILIILLADMSDGNDKTEIRSDNAISFESADIYASGMEERLCTMLSEIEGVGKAKVMLTITSTEEYVFAETQKTSSSQSENSYVIIDNGSKKEALLEKINNPAISGVLIICEGGDDPRVCEKVYIAVSTALNVPTNKIYVAEMK